MCTGALSGFAGGLVSKEDAVCNRLAELALNDLTFAGKLLQDAVIGCEWAGNKMQDRDVCRKFQSSLRQSLQVCLLTNMRAGLSQLCLSACHARRWVKNYPPLRQVGGRVIIPVLSPVDK